MTDAREIVVAVERALAHQLAQGEAPLDAVLAAVNPDELRDRDARDLIAAVAELAADGRHVARATLWPKVGTLVLDRCAAASAELAEASVDELLVAAATSAAARTALRVVAARRCAP